MNFLNNFFISYIRPLTVFGISFVLVAMGSVNMIRYGLFVSALQSSEGLSGKSFEDVLAESDDLDDLLITFNYETIFIQPVEFQKDISAPNILYSLNAGDGIEIGGDAQRPTIRNSGVLSVNGLGGEVTITAGENVTLVEENGILTIKSTDTNTDTKLTEAEVEEYVFDGESTGEFNELQIGSIELSASGTSSSTSGSSLVGVYQGNLTTTSGANVQEILESIDTSLASIETSSHAAVTLGGSLDYLTLTDQQITLNQIDLTTDVLGNLPMTNGGTGADTALGARTNLGLGASDTVGFGEVGVGTTSPTYPLSIVADNPASVTMSMQNTNNTGWTSIRYFNDVGVHSASFGYGNTGAGKFRDITYIQTNSATTPISLATNSTDRLFVTGTGNVGIGTTVPGEKLEVNGNILLSNGSDRTISVEGTSGGTGNNLSIASGWGTAGGGGNLSLDAGGAINNPGSVLINGGYATGSDTYGNVAINYLGGNVGIGTSNPGAILDVQGAAQFGSGNVDLINSTGKIAAINTTYFASVDGSALTNLNASNMASGTVPSARISGSYTGITGLGTVTTGTWQGTAIGAAYLDSSMIASSEIDTSSELAGIMSDETGSGSLVFANTPTFTGTIELTDSSSTKLNFDSLGSSTWGNVVTSTDFAESTGIGFGIGGNSSMTDIPRFVLNADNSYVGWAMRPGDGGALGSTNGDGNLMVRGNVGIGTSNPGATLDVQGAAQFGSGNVDLINSTGKIAAINTTYFASVDGSALTNLNASNLSSGTVATARISGSYTGITGLGTIAAGTWQGTDISATYLDSTLIQSSEIDTYSELNTIVADVTLTHNGLIDTSAELAGIVTNETGSGALVFGTSPSLTTPNIGAANGTSLSLSSTLTTGGIITGTGSGLTGLNASNLSSGTVATARISGSYTGITGLGTIAAGTWQGTDISATYLDSTLIQSSEIDTYSELNTIVADVTLTHNGLIDTSAELAGIVTNETGSGALVFGTSPSLTTPNIGAASGTSLSLTGNLTASQILAGTGSYTAPGLSFGSDTNTGVYANSTLGADYLGFSTGGTQRMVITSGGMLNLSGGSPDWDTRSFFVSNTSGGDSSNSRLAQLEMTNSVSDTGPWDQYGVESIVTNSGSDAAGTAVYGMHGSASNLQSNTTGGSIHESYGVLGTAAGNTNGSSYARGIWCSSSGADTNQCGGNQVWTNTSDRRVKTNIQTIDNALGIVNLLRGVRFQRTDDGSSRTHIGFIAQEVLPYVPEAVYYNEPENLYSMGYAELTAVIVNAIQEQNQIILTNKSRIESANIRLDSTGNVLNVVSEQNRQILTEQSSLLNQINLQNDIQDEQNASTSASLQTIVDRVQSIENMANDVQAVTLGLQERVSQLESLFAMQSATDAASLSENADVLGISDELNLGSLTVTDDTNVNNLGVTGDITAGLLSITGFDDELATPSAIISTLSGPLRIQDQSSGNLEIMGSKVIIDTDGNINVRGSITVKKLNIDETDESTNSIGEGIITSGQNEVTINTTSVTDKSKIFVTGKSVVNTPIVVVEKVPGESFKVKIAGTAESDISFDWLIVN